MESGPLRYDSKSHNGDRSVSSRILLSIGYSFPTVADVKVSVILLKFTVEDHFLTFLVDPFV